MLKATQLVPGELTVPSQTIVGVYSKAAAEKKARKVKQVTLSRNKKKVFC
jgi:hypothetical protein